MITFTGTQVFTLGIFLFESCSDVEFFGKKLSDDLTGMVVFPEKKY
jgi:hypothetical protein